MCFLGKDTPPALSLHSRPKDPRADNFPAPGDYNPDKAEKVVHDNSPKYTFGLKTNVGKPVDTPGEGPNISCKCAKTCLPSRGMRVIFSHWTLNRVASVWKIAWRRFKCTSSFSTLH